MEKRFTVLVIFGVMFLVAWMPLGIAFMILAGIYYLNRAGRRQGSDEIHPASGEDCRCSCHSREEYDIDRELQSKEWRDIQSDYR